MLSASLNKTFLSLVCVGGAVFSVKDGTTAGSLSTPTPTPYRHWLTLPLPLSLLMISSCTKVTVACFFGKETFCHLCNVFIIAQRVGGTDKCSSPIAELLSSTTRQLAPMAQWLSHRLMGWWVLGSHIGSGSNPERVFK